MEKDISDKIMNCLKKINSHHQEPISKNGKIAKWKIKDIFANEFPELKDEIDRL